ncbi:SusC/RagA family TonB-linked outer membrane protein [Pedobacter sp. LMG 31464]|uniref:SusC/RagA family TonB-linked outer membrane protein n=1 Tax=Pedobacter planticolens TaxID=2679964 RepID=A0A923DY36_9SPHI|nr:SusC/RagA family TonB-linked outer membrane protein [Pedobacter planticolens]MBB2144588.1 SusC/RagA family TonB-linked outer membrane protein [Pedobacter planticolens]
MRNLVFLFLVIIIALGHHANAQQIELRGRVISATDQTPLAGVTVKIANGAAGTTNAKGEFKLVVTAQKNKLSISLIGYQTLMVTIDLAQKNDEVFLLQPTIINLNEVTITTGYEIVPKERVTGSFTVIDNKTYNQQIGTGVLERLRFITNGVAPVADRITILGDNAMLIRGMSTLTQNIQRPLVIVDNFEYQGDYNNINPNDIESVSFLKDAAAGSIWGAKAANGVIVLTTKKGKYGQPLKINFTSNLSTAAPPDLYYDKPIAAADLIAVEQFLFAQKYRFTDTARSTHPPFSQVYELLFKQKAGQITSAAVADELRKLSTKDVRADFANYFYQQEINQQYALSLSGGSPVMAWNLSLGVDRNKSNLAATYNRNTLRFGNQIQLNKALALNLDIAFTNGYNGSGKPAYGSISPTNGALPVYSSFADVNGNALPLYTNYRQGYIDNLGAGKLLDWRYYPLEDYKYATTVNRINELNATIGLNYTILPALKAAVNYRIARQWSGLSTLNAEQSYLTRNLINTFTQVNTITGLVNYKVPRGDIYDHTDEVMTAQNLRAQLNYDKHWGLGELHVLAGTEWSERLLSSNTQRLYGYDAEMLGFTPVDVINTYPSYMSGSLTNIPYLDSRGELNNRFTSYYANAAYTFDKRYTLSASARRDASNLFGVATNDRWEPFWSVGASWNVLQEKWFKSAAIQELKLRASYGKQGNVDPKKVAVTTIAYGNNSIYTQTPWSQVANYPNPDLKWEQVGMLNLGIDFNAWKGKLSGSIEYYTKKMSDLYALVAIDRTTGISSGTVTRNIGQAKGHGWDIELKTSHQIGQLNWNADLILNTYTDRITKLNQNNFTGREVMATGFSIVEGYSLSSLFAFKWAGLDPQTGDPMGYLNGQVSKDYSAILTTTKLADATYIGSQFPKLFGSLGSSWRYKGFELTARLSYKFAYFFKRNSIDYGALVTQLGGHADYAKRWQKSGDELYTNVPSFVYPVIAVRDEFYRNSAVLFEKGDHIRLQYLNLSYTLNQSAYKWLPIKAVRLGIAANKLGIIWKANKAGLDPEANTIPRSQNITAALNINF